MARFRLLRLPQVELLTFSRPVQNGGKARVGRIMRLAAAMRKVAANPKGLTTRARAELALGFGSFHIQHASAEDPDAKVRRPVRS